MIYLITTLKYEGVPPFKRTRCVGYFMEHDVAVEAVENNWGDIYEEGYYNYAVIEGVKEGLYPICIDRETWFIWSEENEAYAKTDKPAELEGICGWGIG